MDRDTGAISVGSEWVIDAAGCDPLLLRNLETLRALFASIIRDLSLNLAADPLWKVFPGEGGITGMVLLQESHLTIHTFPEYGVATLNLYCCSEHPAWEWKAGLARCLGATSVQVRQLRRGWVEGAAAGVPASSRERPFSSISPSPK